MAQLEQFKFDADGTVVIADPENPEAFISTDSPAELESNL